MGNKAAKQRRKNEKDEYYVGYENIPREREEDLRTYNDQTLASAVKGIVYPRRTVMGGHAEDIVEINWKNYGISFSYRPCPEDFKELPFLKPINIQKEPNREESKETLKTFPEEEQEATSLIVAVKNKKGSADTTNKRKSAEMRTARRGRTATVTVTKTQTITINREESEAVENTQQPTANSNENTTVDKSVSENMEVEEKGGKAAGKRKQQQPKRLSHDPTLDNCSLIED